MKIIKSIYLYLRQRRKEKLMIKIAGYEEKQKAIIKRSIGNTPSVGLARKIGRAKKKLELLIIVDSGGLKRNKAKLHIIK